MNNFDVLHYLKFISFLNKINHMNKYPCYIQVDI